jgi:hypothetical protein
MAREAYVPSRISTMRVVRFVGMCVTICLLIVPLAGCREAAPTPEPMTASADGPVTVRFAGYHLDEEY